MSTEQEKAAPNTKVIDVEKSVKRAKRGMITGSKWSILGAKYEWSSKMDRVRLIRNGLPYESIEVIGMRADLPVKRMLRILGMPQTTYNKKRRDQDVMSGRDSEVILVLTELLDFGVEVFNNEKDKFQRWLKKPNLSLGGATPESLFDSLTGIQEVRNCLNRIEFGNMA